MDVVKNKNTTMDMTQGSIFRNLVFFAVPLIISEFLQQLYNIVDSVIVGKCVGPDALAAVSGVVTITMLFIGAATGISVGATVIISHAFGAKDYGRMNSAVNSICKLSLIMSVILTVLAIVLIDPLLKICAMPDNIYPLAKAYLTVYFLGTPALVFYNMFSGILKAVGNSVKPLIALAITAASNIVLDMVFIMVFKMGVRGAAFATILAQYVSAFAIYFMLTREPIFEKPIIKKDRMDAGIIKSIFLVGGPTCIQKIVIVFSNIFIWSYINAFGSVATAAWGCYYKLDNFVINIIVSLSVALTTFTSQHVGAGKTERIFKGTFTCQGLMFIVMSVYLAIMICFPRTMMGIFTDDNEIISLGADFLRWLMPFNFFNSITHNISGNLKGRGHSVAATVILLSCYVAIRQAFLFFWAGHTGSIRIIVSSWWITWIIGAVVSVVYLFYLKRKEGF